MRSLVKKQSVEKMGVMIMDDFKLTVLNFEYNGFYGQLTGWEADYKARFFKWTEDPGVGVFSCSDGETRLIPTFALKPAVSIRELPKQEYKNGPHMFGAPYHRR